MQAGYSTAPDNVRTLGFGAGMGLPNIAKYSDELKIDTEVGKGTTLYITVFAKRPEKKGKSVFPGAGKASQQQNGNVRPGNFADSYRFGDSSAADHAL